MIKKWLDGAVRDYCRLIVAIALNGPIVFLVFVWSARRVDFGVLTWVYLCTVTFGYYLLAMWFSVTIVYLVFLPLRKVAIGFAAAIACVFIYYFIIDSFVFNLTSIHIDPFWLEWIVSDFGAFGISSGTLRLALLGLVVAAAVEMVLFALAWRTRPRKIIGVSLFAALVVSLIFSQITHAVAYEKNDVRVTDITTYLPIYYPVTSHSEAAKYGGLLPLGEDIAMEAGGGDHGILIYPLRNLEYGKPKGRDLPNIVVFFFESWRYDMMTGEVTPNTFALSRQSTVCSRHFCSGNSTVAGIFGFFYGLCPSYWTAVKGNNNRIHNPVLIDILEDYGYDFGIFAKSNFKRHKIKDTVFRGIEVRESFSNKSKVKQDLEMTRQLISYIREQKKNGNPFFAFAFYKSNHAPYWYPSTDTLFRPAGDQNLILADDETDPSFYLNDYKNSTHYVDELIGRVLREMNSLGLMSNTIIIVTTDHGEQFNDDRSNHWGHGTNFTQYQTMVPLVIFAPGKKPRTITRPTSHVDVAPTLLQEFLYCTNDVRDYSNGRNLFRGLEDARPFVVGSYVNHAFVFEDNVFDTYPVYTRSYKLSDIREKASPPSHRMLKSLIDEMSRFYMDTSSGSQCEPISANDTEVSGQ
jgi:membrane-anchored protein YejM (alkaline phosphatase superfamily)